MNKAICIQVASCFLRKFSNVVLASLLLGSIHANATVEDAIYRPAILSELGAKAFLTSADQVGNNLVAVGERGLILLSEDDGTSWRQVSSPVSVTLTEVQFFDDKNGYAIGHGGTVLRTINGGEDWQVQLNGRQLASDLLAQAEKNKDKEAIRQATFLVEDGPDKPFLDMLVLDAQHLIVVGAYGLALESKDAGKTWVSWMDRLENDFGLHLYSIRKQGERILVAGEQGFVTLSMDDGQSFTSIETPYEGSFFTAQLQGDSKIVLAGLRGTTLVSNDNGENWKHIKNPIHASILASFINADGQITMANQAGILLGLKADSLVPVTRKRLPPLTNVVEKSNGSVLALSIHGPVSIDVGDFK
ncbi:WD40/YVTN/BNR-like repeat-containing protein [Marinomonas transparens]|uniref:Photosynthesis system II assembly factor Ycf48/Hcf136-like domain-containing protein n=1 Tax=Marinomonas transparens TaxID=2795388 RepID=A0A934N0K2_9GAMM|nr:YCF48-related protein [Marinomonas transparens]MBJ7538645.1 hypothetical protein [Marinomonas transparens]